MKKIKVLMCGHTGSRNRGCEAIIRSTHAILEKCGIDSEAMTFDLAGDRNVGLDQTVALTPYPQKTLWDRGLSFAAAKLLNNHVMGSGFYHKKVLAPQKETERIVFNVGGDTYCYTTPWISIAMNRIAQKNGYPTVFWGCSVDERIHTDKVLQADINRYDYIVARESYSYNILKQHYHNPEHLYLACDPAFHLEVKETQLPDGFIPGQTVGINISPIMVNMDDIENSPVFQNCVHLIRHICQTSSLNVCLIPHVYRVSPADRDYMVLKKLHEVFCDDPRVSIVDKELSASELKYIISQCRFFIGSRTHSIIAAYSTEVPALALSYSVKARGLAQDVMGSETNYSVPWREITEKEQLTQLYEQQLVKNETEIRQRLHDLMPEYKQTVLRVAEEIGNAY
jgi:polysaccharide pyruvyl transferase WcaK-like protein